MCSLQVACPAACRAAARCLKRPALGVRGVPQGGSAPGSRAADPGSKTSPPISTTHPQPYLQRRDAPLSPVCKVFSHDTEHNTQHFQETEKRGDKVKPSELKLQAQF